MKKAKNIFKGGFIILILASILLACKKDISEIGVDIVGNNPLEVIFIDTIEIKAYSEIIDSMRTDELSSHLLGAYKDPVFGTINASIYAQFLLRSADVDHRFGDDPVLDSVVLHLAYASNETYGGDPDDPSQNHISIYEIGEQMDLSTDYYHFQNLRTKSELLAESVFIPSFDSVEYEQIVGEDTTIAKKIPPLSIRLSDAFGQRFIDADTIVYDDQESFIEEFAGLYITTLDQHLPQTKGSLMNINFRNDDTKITLYYHNTTDTLELSFIANSSSAARFGNYNHYDYQDASDDFKQQVLEGETALGSEMVYLQSLAGVRTIIQFPNINRIDDYYNYAINEAKLFLWDAEDTTTVLDPIDAVTITYKINDSTYSQIPEAIGGGIYFDGQYNSGNQGYVCRMTQHIQSIISGETEYNFIRIEPIGGAVRANRSLIHGFNPEDQDKRIKLQVLYTQIDSD
jgi:hypothetical protein